MQEIWHVKLPSGDVKPLSLDELDAAYEAGRIDLSTPVLPPAAITWSTLGNVAGLDPEPMPLSIAPVAYGPDLDVDLSASDLDDVPAELRPRRTGRKVFGFLVAVAVVAGLGFAATKARPGMTASASAFVRSHLPLPGKHAPAPAKVAAAAPAPPPPAVTAAPAPSPTVAASAVPMVSAADLKPVKKGKRR
jgi:hypothetical protein